MTASPPIDRPSAPASVAVPRFILLVEDDPGDVLLLRRLLAAHHGETFEVAVVDRIATARKHLLSTQVDCVILDLSLPDSTGLDSVEHIHTIAPDVPLVVLSSLHDEQMAQRALQHGAQDYLVKSNADGESLSRALRYATERKRAEVELRFQAEHDPLTGLVNRTRFVRHLSYSLSRLAHGRSHLAVVLVDLDRFKRINDSLGHRAGDVLIIQAASRVRAIMRPGDLVGRFGGDELLLLLHDLADPSDAEEIAARVHGVIGEPFVLGDTEVRITASIGIATTDQPRTDPESLLQDVDVAMYRAKSRGRSRSERFDERLRQDAEARLRVETELHHAIDGQELVVHYQPIVRLTDGRTVGAEALVRWAHPDGTLKAPGYFIDVAEETGQILSIGNHVLRDACTQLATWSAGHNDPPFELAVNLSTRQLIDSDVVRKVRQLVDESGIDATQLCLEVTEHALMADEDAAQRCLRELKSLGVRLAIDDFGTGYSSLTYLKLFPFDVLKIDRSFTAGLDVNAHDTAIVTGLIGLAELLDLQVVVEGVETQAQAERLRGLGCELAQGFLFSPAVEPSALTISRI